MRSAVDLTDWPFTFLLMFCALRQFTHMESTIQWLVIVILHLYTQRYGHHSFNRAKKLLIIQFYTEHFVYLMLMKET